MRMRRWLAHALAGTLAGCYVEPSPDEPPDFPEDPSEPPEPPEPPDPDDPTGGPDFLVEEVTAPFVLSPAQGRVQARLCNRGHVSGSAEVSFFLSKDETLDPLDVRVATSSRIRVLEDSCETVTGEVSASEVPEGDYFLLAFADPDDSASEANEDNNRRVGSSVRVDFTPPLVPSLSWVLDASSQQLPRLLIQSEVGASVRIYGGGLCSGAAIAESSVGESSSFELPIDISQCPESSYSVRVHDAAGNASGCKSIPAPEEEDEPGDTTPPGPPVISEAAWQNGLTEQELHVKGTTEPGAEVSVFVDAECTGQASATVFASTTGAFEVDLTVATASEGTVRKVFVAARDAAHNASECVEGPSYETPCSLGYGNCDGNAANGCEVNLTEDANHCGACSTSCQAQVNTLGVCVAGTCGTACPVGQYDCDGDAANGCESFTACTPGTCTISRSEELAITALSVVEDPVRTAPGGAWSFGTLMRALAGDQDPSALVRHWLETWSAPQTVNGLTLPARQQMQSKVLGPWEAKSGGANQPLDFTQAPFRLLAIINRVDLRDPGVQAGEGRFVFGVLDAEGNPFAFTVILEYALPGGSPEALQRWAKDWHELGQLGQSHSSYNVKLQALTDRFTKTGVMTGRPLGSALNQLRTNEADLADPWEMREFHLTNAGLQPVTVKQTPEFAFENSDILGDFIQSNEAAILAEQYVIPERINGVPFLGASSVVPEKFFWRAPGVSTEARHKFSLHTCSGCHAGETATDFTHVSPRRAGRVATLSVFMRGGTVKDPWTQEPRTFDDLGRRAEDLSALVCGTSTQGLVPSNLPRVRVH
ncbi:hypothetical protein [Hyalangium versicolor]|uniref:hypothetical protein n=1 Tax=Hyalangium versicolor TaxID=2861190 RepID=UPI001CCE1645|nr:hypothetical protein [Hyalangium versicolor]